MDDLIPGVTEVYIAFGHHKGKTVVYPGGATIHLLVSGNFYTMCYAEYKIYWSRRFKQWRGRPTK